MQIEVIATTELGDRSYVAHDDTLAIVVDPQRDIDRVQRVLSARRVTCALVLETHIHNDYVTGGFALARATGAQYAISAHDTVSFEHRGLHDGDIIEIGDMTVKVMATPGHTGTHLSYVISDRTGAAPAVFSGGSLLYGSVGRTDLADKARTEELTRAQFHSAKLLAELPDEAALYPTHGFGSFCSSGSTSGGDGSTIGNERLRNDALTESDEDAFVEHLIAGLTAYPAYYAHMDPLNRQGPHAVDLVLPQRVDAAELHKRIGNGEWVVDLRDRKAYAAEHIGGTVSIALGEQFTTYLGWLFPWGSPLTLVGESELQVLDAQRQLIRIGIDRLDAVAADINDLSRPDERRTYRRVTFIDLATIPRDAMVLDVRRDDA